MIYIYIMIRYIIIYDIVLSLLYDDAFVLHISEGWDPLQSFAAGQRPTWGFHQQCVAVLTMGFTTQNWD